jgi:hypothetical protein
MAVDELDKAAALARRNLDVGDLSEALEERAELVLGDVTRETADENSRVVGIGELVHGLHGVELALAVEGGRDSPHGTGMSSGSSRHHLIAALALSVLVRAAAG